jgi:predicted transcriptional regulator
MNSTTTIKIYPEIKSELDHFREHKNESYSDVIKKILYIVKNTKENPKLSIETINAIENARKRIKNGNFVNEEEAKKRLGF